MDKLLDNIDIELVEHYLWQNTADDKVSERTDSEVRSIIKFLEWAYERNYISFFKYQQTKDVLDNYLLDGLSEQSKIEDQKNQTQKVNKFSIAPKPETENNHFLIKHAYLLFPMVTGIIVLFLYIYIQSSSNTVSPVQLSSIVTQPRSTTSGNTARYILNYQSELKDEFGIPLNEPTSLRFRLYQGQNTTNALYDSATGPDCVIKPLIDGTVQVDVGRACGEPIPGSIFTSNASQLWLGVTIGSAAESQPRKLVTLTPQGLSINTSASQNESSNPNEDLLNEIKLSSNGTDTIIQSTDSAHIRLLNGSTQAMDVSPNGNVGINKDNPTSKLDVVGDTTVAEGNLSVSDDETNSTTVKIENKNKSENADGAEIKLGYEGNGSNGNSYMIFKNGISRIQGRIHSNQNGGVSYATTGSDFAEYFRKDLTTSYNHESFSPGTVVCHTFVGIAPCNTSSKYIVGAISDNPGFIGGANLEDDSDYALVGLVGQLSIKVYNDGSIQPGDALTFSTYPGYASKAYSKGYIIGYALEKPKGKGLATIKTHIQPSFYDPIVYTGLPGQENNTYLAQVSTRVKTLIADLIEATTAKVETLLAKTVKTDTLVTNTIESPQIETIQENISDLKDKSKINTFIASDNNSAATQENDSRISTATSSTTSATTTKATSINTSSADAGEGFIKAGEKSVIIYNKNVQPQALVYLTSTSTSQNRTIYIAEKRGCEGEKVEQNDSNDISSETCRPYFKVSIDKPVDQDITFNWWVVNE